MVNEQPDWQIYLRDGRRQHIALFDDYTKFEAILRDRKETNWVLDLPLSTSARMVKPGFGIIAIRNGETMLSGPINKIARQSQNFQDSMTIAGVDDTALIADRLALPQPDTAGPPYNIIEYDVRTGTASSIIMQYANVNAGPGAIASRRIPGMVMGKDPAVGRSVTGRARYHSLNALLDSLGLRANLAYRIIQTTGGTVEFQVIPRRDKRQQVQFSNEIGNIGNFSYTIDAPGANYVIIGGGGEGTSRAIVEGSAPASQDSWGRRIEMFRDRRDTIDVAEMQETVDEHLTEVAAKTTLEMNVIDTPQMGWRTHYELGDLVTVVIDGVEIEEPIKEIKITLDGSGERVEPVVGTPGGDAGPNATVSRLLNRISTLEGRIANIERR